MRNAALKCAVLVVGIFVLGFSIVRSCAEVPTRVVLVAWDGVDLNHLIEILEDESVLAAAARIGPKGENLPTSNFLPSLKRASREGRMIKISITEKTDTKAGWSQILTGYNADVTGVYSNPVYKEIPAGYTIFGRLHNRFGGDNVYNLMVTGKGAHVGSMETKKGKQPYFEAKQYLDYQHTDKERENDEVFDLAIEGLRDYAARHVGEHLFAFVHFADPDRTGHNYGEGSPEYRQALESDDYYTGKIIRELESLGLYDDTILYITSDHGFDEGKSRYPIGQDPLYIGRDHLLAPWTFLATNHGPSLRTACVGNRRDIGPTILEDFGVGLTAVEPPLSGRSLASRNFPGGVGGEPVSQTSRPRALLISWSGANRTRVRGLLESGDLPNLKGLVSEGRLIDIDIPRAYYYTPHGWYPALPWGVMMGADPITGTGCLLTGYKPETTGIYSHRRIDASLDDGYTIFEHLEEKYGDGVVTALLMGRDASRCRHADVDDPTIDNIDKIFLKNRDEIDVYMTSLQPEQVIQESMNMLNANNGKERMFAFIHFSYPDHAGHEYGEASQQYKDAIVACDDELGALVDALEDLGVYDETAIYVTATNGFENEEALSPYPYSEYNDESGEQGHTHQLGSYVFLATNDKAIRRHGTQLDIAPTILSNFGIETSQIYPALPGEDLDNVFAAPPARFGKRFRYDEQGNWRLWGTH